MSICGHIGALGHFHPYFSFMLRCTILSHVENSPFICLTLRAKRLLMTSPYLLTVMFFGKIFRGTAASPVKKYGNSLSVKVCEKVCSCVLVSGSEKDSFPLFQSSWTLILRGFKLTERTVDDHGESNAVLESAVYLPSFNIILHS